MRISVIIPLYQDHVAAGELLIQLQALRDFGHEVIVVDASPETDYAVTWARLVDQYIRAEKGRAVQMNTGAKRARGDILWFVHADSRIPASCMQDLWLALYNGDRVWGRFDVRLSGTAGIFRLVEFLMNWRSALTGIATGDQGLFVLKTVFQKIDGYQPLQIMEDIDLCRRLKKLSWPVCLRSRLQTSSRRWETRGVLRTILLMWRMRLAFFFGVDPKRLARWYE